MIQLNSLASHTVYNRIHCIWTFRIFFEILFFLSFYKKKVLFSLICGSMWISSGECYKSLLDEKERKKSLSFRQHSRGIWGYTEFINRPRMRFISGQAENFTFGNSNENCSQEVNIACINIRYGSSYVWAIAQKE